MSQQKKCKECGAEFGCGSEGQNQCWCHDLPNVMPFTGEQDCLCPKCLEKAIKEKLKEKQDHGEAA